MAPPILELINFSKSFRSHWTYRQIPAVSDISFSVSTGEAFGFLGHNGAGKTTTIKCIAGLIHKTSGKILFDGHALSGTDRAELGYLPELPYFYDHLTVEETLTFFASLHGISGRKRATAVCDTLELVGLADRKKSSVRSLSKGLQQRLGLAQAIINKPRLLLLDEPFSGLDPIGRLEFRRIILEMKRQGTTLFLSSHILSDVENICDRVSIMAKGVIKADFSLADAPKLYGESYLLVIESSVEQSIISKCAGAVTDSPGHYRFSNYAQASDALRQAAAAGIRVLEFKSSGPDLEAIFMQITNQSRAEEKVASVTKGAK